MKGYLNYFKTQVIVGLQYKASAISGLLTQLFWGFLFAFIYISFYSKANIDNINLTELMCYTWLGQAFFSLTYPDIKVEDLVKSIKNGTVAYELCRPYNLYNWWFIKVVAKRYARVILRCLPIIIFSLLLPKPYNLTLPYSALSLILTVLTLFLGSIVTSGINMIVLTLSFFTMQDKGISSIFYTIGGLLGGLVIPLPLLPNFIIKMSEYLPFRLIGDLPFRVYSGNIGTTYAIESIILQIIWIITLILIGKVLMNRALKKVCIQGG